MNSVFPGTIPPPTHSVINFRRSASILLTRQAYALFVVLSRKPGLIKFPALDPCQLHRAQDKYALHYGNPPKHKEGRAKWQKR